MKLARGYGARLPPVIGAVFRGPRREVDCSEDDTTPEQTSGSHPPHHHHHGGLFPGAIKVKNNSARVYIRPFFVYYLASYSVDSARTTDPTGRTIRTLSVVHMDIAVRHRAGVV